VVGREKIVTLVTNMLDSMTDEQIEDALSFDTELRHRLSKVLFRGK
jgi:hypothetical protein